MAAHGNQGSTAGVSLRAEDELLLLCARARVTAAQEDRIRALAASGVDWSALVQAALWHGVLPLLTRRLLAVCPDALPTLMVKELLGRREGLARANRALALELVRLLGLFKRQGIDAVGVKGPMLAAHVYGNLALREFGDLDILIRRRDTARVHRLLLAEGYQVEIGQDPGTVFFRRVGLAHYHQHYKHPRTATVVEIHWRIGPRYISSPLEAAELWRRIESRRLLSAMVPDLAADDVLLLLCIHGSKHVWDRLKLVCDLAACIERYPALDWPRLVGRARSLRVERMLYVALDLTRRLLGVPLPDPISVAIGADPAIAALSAQLAARLIARQEFSRFLWVFEMLPYWLQFKDRRRDRLLVYPYLVYVLWFALGQTSAKDLAWVRLPARLAPLYYLLRPVRVGTFVALLTARAAARRLRAVAAGANRTSRPST